MTVDELNAILAKHQLWLRNKPGGECANLSGADLRGANLRGANLRGADLRDANLRDADLSGTAGLLDPADWLDQNFEHDPAGRGYIVYKQFGNTYSPPASWKQEPGAVITEVVNPDRTNDCACGVNFATKDWPGFAVGLKKWRCLLWNLDLAGVVVPYVTDGKVRCARLELIEVVTD
jgi:hypothetical protein